MMVQLLILWFGTLMSANPRYRVMIYLLMPFLLLACNQNSMNKNIDTFGYIEKNIEEQITITTENLNVRIFYKGEEVLNTIIRVDSIQLDSYKKTILALSNHITTDTTSIYFKERKKVFFLKNNDNVRACLLNFDQNIQLTKRLNDAINLKVILDIEENNFDKALTMAEMSVYLRHPFYFGVYKDDRYLKIFTQKELFKNGKKMEAINNLLKLN